MENEAAKEVIEKEWSGLSESNRHLNLGKVAFNLKKRWNGGILAFLVGFKWKISGKWNSCRVIQAMSFG
jgi:hypothetical protein